MSSADALIAFNQGGFTEPMEGQDHFAQQFNLDNPEEAKSSYQRVMHQHTMQQFESATESRRRAGNDTALPSLTSEESRGSVSSNESPGSVQSEGQ
ncbi:hypothetical protein LTR85_005848 [Meristemomyces frigidus]|nr:hypothetical protein LTR85_005848 [Meristemomyces frigidus]